MVMRGVKNIKTTQDGSDIDQVKLIIVCPQSSWWTNVSPDCGCKHTSEYSCESCEGRIWIDKMGNTFCTQGCPGNGTRSIFELNIEC